MSATITLERGNTYPNTREGPERWDELFGWPVHVSHKRPPESTMRLLVIDFEQRRLDIFWATAQELTKHERDSLRLRRQILLAGARERQKERSFGESFGDLFSRLLGFSPDDPPVLIEYPSTLSFSLGDGTLERDLFTAVLDPELLFKYARSFSSATRWCCARGL